MSGREDTRLVDHLYGELSEKEAREYRRALEQDPALASEAESLESLESTLGLMRQHEDEEPSPHLDSLILAHAREEATKLAESGKGVRGFLKKMFRSPALGLAVAGSVAAVVAVVTVPVTLFRGMDESAPAMVPMTESVRVQPETPAKEQREAKLEAQLGEAEPTDETPPPPPKVVSAERRLDKPSRRRATESPSGGANGFNYQAEKRPEPSKPVVTQKPAEPAADVAEEEDAPAVATTPRERNAKDSLQDSFEDAEMLGDLKSGGDSAPGAGVASNVQSSADDDATTLKRAEKPPATRQPLAAEKADKAASTSVETVAEAKKSKSNQAARGPATSTPQRESPPVAATVEPQGRAETKTGATKFDPGTAAEYASSFIRAAETQLGLKDSVGARRILVAGLAQTKGTPAYGELALRLAQLDYAERRLADAVRNARVAANVPSFAKRRMALDLMERAQRESTAAQAAPSEASRAKKAAPAKARAAEPAEADQKAASEEAY